MEVVSAAVVGSVASLVPRPFCYAHAREGKKGLGNNYTLARARGWNLKKIVRIRAAIQTSAGK